MVYSITTTAGTKAAALLLLYFRLFNLTNGFLHPLSFTPSSAIISKQSSMMIRDGLNKKHTNDPITKLFVSTTINNNNISGGENGFYRESSTSTNSDSMKKEDDVKVGVLMLNLGGPEKTEDVEGFLYNLFADPDIIRLPPPLAPLQGFIALFISKRRAPKSIAAYNSIGGGSPILQYSNDQANLVASSLLKRYGLNVKTYIGMRYWYPFTEEALEAIRKDGINALVIIPLYPQFSISTSGSSLRVLQEEFASKPQIWGDKVMSHTVVPQWYDRPGYIKSMANIIKKELDTFTPEECDEQLKTNKCIKHILFSAHGVPQSYIEAGDPYQQQIVECVEKIKAELPSEEEGVQVHLSYQSRVGPIEWLRPYTDDVLPELGENGVKNLVVVPISFVSEHIETLEEIDIEYRELAEESGISNWRRAPALNTDITFIDDMADMVWEALNQPSQSVTEACVANNVGTVNVDEKRDISLAGVGGVGGDDELFELDGVVEEAQLVGGRVAIVAILGALFAQLAQMAQMGGDSRISF